MVIHIGSCTWILNEPCNNQYVQFFLYTRQNEKGEIVNFTETNNSLNSSHFDPNKPTKIIVHGYNDDQFLDALVQIRTSYALDMDSNVWMVDWQKLAIGPCYTVAVYNLRHVGKCMAAMIQKLRDAGASDLHLVGFSLGAHALARTAYHLKPYKVPRATGLDPAMPLFVFSGKEHKISKDDADFVDIMHTNALVQGLIEPLGHVDFYMNGGTSQPGCNETKAPLSCDHHRAPEYFAESITSKVGFWGWKCSSFFEYLTNQCKEGNLTALMGEHSDPSVTGLYMVKTAAVSPYALGK